MVVATAKMNGAGHPAKKNQKKENGESSTTSSNPSTTTTAMEVSEEARAAVWELKAIREDAKRDLEAVLPALQAANRALQALKTQDIAGLQKYGMQKDSISWGKLTMEAVCVMLRLEPVDEVEVRDYSNLLELTTRIPPLDPSNVEGVDGPHSEVARELLSDPAKFLAILLSYDKDNISEATIRQVAPFLEMEGFEPAAVKRSSGAACGALCRWVRAMHMYHMVAKETAAKRERIQQLQARLVELRGTTKKQEPMIIATQPEETQPAPFVPALPDHGRLLLGNEKEEL